MGLLESAILSMCVGATSPACTNAIQAGAKQSGIEQTTQAYEDKQIRVMEKQAVETMGKDGAEVVGGTVWITKSLLDKHATFGLPNMGLCDKLATEVNQNEAKLVFRWTF